MIVCNIIQFEFNNQNEHLSSNAFFGFSSRTLGQPLPILAFNLRGKMGLGVIAEWFVSFLLRPLEQAVGEQEASLNGRCHL